LNFTAHHLQLRATSDLFIRLRIAMKGIADLLDSDMEDSTPFIDENSILSSASDATNAPTTKRAPAKKAKKRQRVTMPAKSKAKVKSGAQASEAAPNQTAGVKRKAAPDLDEDEGEKEPTDMPTNIQAEPEPAQSKPAKKARPAAKPKAVPKAPPAPETEDELMETDETPLIARSNHAPAKSKQAAPKVVKKTAPKQTKAPQQFRSIVTEVPQTGAEESNLEVENIPLSPPKPRVVARDTSRSRQEPTFRRRAGSASDTERGDPNLRRKLGDITRKFENVDLKYRNLKEVGIDEANANMERLRKQCDATMQASNDLIASLKKELASQTPLAHEARKLKSQMQNQENEMSKMRKATTDLTDQLATAQNEIKALQAKVAAARTATAEAAKTPGSAIKKPGPRQIAASATESSQALQAAQMKLDLYSDLTGLVVLGVKKSEEGDTYECIQTGQNGSKYSPLQISRLSADHLIALHFRLFIDQENAKSMSFEETEYLYTPLLDADRDHDMMELMPTYLTEEITFARLNASKFYGRVVDTLTKKRVEE
jgi:hypothetical protein